MKTLRKSGVLGRYALGAGRIQLEYQLGRRLIWVVCRSGESEDACVARADEMLDMACRGIPDALALGEQASRVRLPAFWAAHDRSGVHGHRLDVWSVTLTPHEGTMSYDISRNHDFDFDAPAFEPDDALRERPIALPDFPDEEMIVVDRSASGLMQLRRPLGIASSDAP